MLAAEFILGTFSHFVKDGDGPPPGIPAHTGVGFEQDLLRLSEYQRLSPVVVHSLERLVLEPILSRLSLERLKRHAKSIERNNVRIRAKIQSVTSLFQNKGIPFMLLGSVATSEVAYSNPALRAIDKINFLVKELDWPGVLECMAAAGFRQAGGGGEVEAPQNALRYHQLSVPCLFRDAEGDEIHISFRIFHLGVPEEEEIAWIRCSATGSLAPFARMPSLEDLLIRHAIDLLISDFSNLWIVLDIAVLLERNRGRLDWAYIEQRLRDRGHYAGFYFVLKHVGDLLQLRRPYADLPHPGSMRERLFEFAWDTVEPNYFAGGEEEQKNLKFGLLESRTLGNRAALLREIVSPASEWVSAFYGRPHSKQLKLQFIMRSLCGKWMRPKRPQEDVQETHDIKPGQRLLE
jgi:hypothetical protein